MCIANELSYEVASALLAEAAPPAPSGAAEMARIVLLCHETLRSLEREERRQRQRGRLPDPDAARAASGGPQPV